MRAAVAIEVAGVPIAFTGTAGDTAVVAERYRAFRVGQPTAASVVSLTLRDPEGEMRAGSLDMRVDAGRVVLHGNDVTAVLAPDGQWARLEAPREGRFVDLIVRYVVATRLLEAGGLLVHASAVVVDGRAWLFVGASGAGKSTTLSALTETGAPVGVQALGDEAIAMTPGTGWVAQATPYGPTHPDAAELTGIVFLNRRTEVCASPVSEARTAARLAANCGPLLGDSRGRALEIAQACAAHVPAYEVSLPAPSRIAEWLVPRLRGGF